MGKLKYFIALWVAKFCRLALKLTGHHGTTLPGKLALKICPDLLRYVGKPDRIITVSGTNGKTTVLNLVCDILEQDGKTVMSNRAGANIITGISTAFLMGVTVFNRSKYDVAVVEVDERSSRLIYSYMTPDYLVITNLFRDSIMRNAHPQYMADFLTGSIPAGTKLILNADDLISASVAPDNPRVYYGIERMDTDVTECVNLINDIRICPKCRGQLQYDYRRYHHIGKARCLSCGFESPAYDYTAGSVDTGSMTMTVSDDGGTQQYRLLSDSVFNIYNEVAAVALFRELGMDHEKLAGYVDKIHIAESRYHLEHVGNVDIIMHMAKDKNALACSRVFDYVSQVPGQKELFLMMSCLGDEQNWSENMCWLYDCDFEFLLRPGIDHIVSTGPRARDFRLRMLIAGIPEERISLDEDEMTAAELLRFEPGSSIYIFYGTDSIDQALAVREKIKQLAKEAAK